MAGGGGAAPGNAGRGLGAELTVRGVDDLDAGFAQEATDGGAAIGGDGVDGEPAGGLAVGDLGDAERLGAAQPDVTGLQLVGGFADQQLTPCYPMAWRAGLRRSVRHFGELAVTTGSHRSHRSIRPK